ncbi:MAG: cyclic nucleotide-binding domain-containing protein, partial [Gammaproteobacteria bacterium]|nr:cyclic nucleotide-binding domain-containing protein [Gammaproteobacteria bacterium]
MNKTFDLAKLKVSCRNCNLYQLCLPRGLDEQELGEFERLVTPNRPLQAGGSLYQAKDLFASIFAIKSGSMKSVLSTADGEEQIVGFHLPGELVGF